MSSSDSSGDDELLSPTSPESNASSKEDWDLHIDTDGML